MRFFKHLTLMALAAFYLAVLCVSPTWADSQVRLEYVLVNEGPGLAGGGSGTTNLLAAEAPSGAWLYTVTAAAPLTGASAITPPAAIFTTANANNARPHVRVSVITGSVAVLTDGSLTTPTAANGRIVIAGDDNFVSLKPGDKISIVDLPVANSTKNNGLTDSQLRASPVPIQLNGSTSPTGAANSVHIVSTASTNASLIKNSGGRVVAWTCGTTATSPRFLKLYNSASAPTVGSTAVARTVMIPASGVAQLEIAVGLAFSSGIGAAITTGLADADTGATVAGDTVCDVHWQ
jgi:hypothetical protein